MRGLDDRARAAGILGLVTLAKLVLAVVLPLGVDEAYQVAVARPLSLSYFDHPPLSFWAMAGSAALLGESVLAYRLPFVAMGAGTAWLLYLIGARLGGARAGLWAMVLYLAAPHMFFGSGLFVLPDGPLDLAGAVAGWLLVRMAGQARPPVWAWAALGAALAAGFMSKYQSALIPFSVFVFMGVWPGRWRWLIQPGFWVGVVIALLGTYPVLGWNIAHDWASFAFHGDRTERSLQLANFAVMGVGQALYLLPVTFGIALLAIWRGLRARLPEDRMLGWLAALPIAVFNGIFVFSDASFPHWTMPGFLFALPLAGAMMARAAPRLRWWLAGTGAVIWGLVAFVALHATMGLLGPKDRIADWDDTTAFFEWSDMGPILAERGDLAGVDLIAVPNWIEGGQIGAALPGWPMRVLDPGIPHHFALMPGAALGGSTLYLQPERLDSVADRGAAALARLRGLDPMARALPPVVLTRGGQPYAGVIVIRMDLPAP